MASVAIGGGQGDGSAAAAASSAVCGAAPVTNNVTAVRSRRPRQFSRDALTLTSRTPANKSTVVGLLCFFCFRVSGRYLRVKGNS